MTTTQHLRPSVRHHPVVRWVDSAELDELARVATDLGFAGVMSWPLVRSTYRGGRLHAQAVAGRTIAQAPVSKEA